MFNPLDHIEEVKRMPKQQPAVSTSSLEFTSDSHCPRCGNSFEQARAALDIPVNYCPKCRVATPVRD